MGNEPFDWPVLVALVVTLTVTGVLVHRFLGRYHVQDRLMLRRLKVAGVNLGQPQSVGFLLFVKTETIAGTLCEELRGEGFDATATSGEIQFTRGREKAKRPQAGWLVTARRSMTIEPEEVKRLRAVLDAAAQAHGGLYLGWHVKTD